MKKWKTLKLSVVSDNYIPGKEVSELNDFIKKRFVLDNSAKLAEIPKQI